MGCAGSTRYMAPQVNQEDRYRKVNTFESRGQDEPHVMTIEINVIFRNRDGNQDGEKETTKIQKLGTQTTKPIKKRMSVPETQREDKL